MKSISIIISSILLIGSFSLAQAQSPHEAPLCEAVKTNRTIELVYDKDVSKGCEPRLVDVHQVAVGNDILCSTS